MLAAVGWTLLLHPVPAAPPAAEKVAAIQTRNSLSSENVLGILLLLLGQQDALMRPALKAMYQSSFVSTELRGRTDVERYLALICASRYKPEVSGSVFAAMMAYQKMLAAEMREDRRASPSRLRASTIRVATGLKGPALEQFADKAGDWLHVIEAALRSLQTADIAMLQLQEAHSQRQRAIALTGSLMQALGEAARQIAANAEPAPSTQSEGSSSDSGGGSSCPPCGCSCP